MNGEIISILSQGALPGARLDEPVLGPAAASDVSRFANAMASPAGASHGWADVGEVARAGWSDAFMHSMQEFGRGYAEQSNRIKQILSDPTQVGATELLSIQLGLVDTSLRVELVSRAVQKATQHIDQLTKLQ
ncbi:hypothetical protein GCM10023165_34280 [Variovorax defluvii]|uniref:EscI/YscI/HrpB family type III secretion system inner rod protein n=1 Tax=Variovorax defluvii TaxID=913761 RepID=A0ABP8I064_9BURK